MLYLWWLIVYIFYYYYFSSSSIRPNVLRWRTPCRQPRPLWSVKTTTKILRQRPLRTILRTILLYKKYESLEIRSGLKQNAAKTKKKHGQSSKILVMFLFPPCLLLVVHNHLNPSEIIIMYLFFCHFSYKKNTTTLMNAHSIFS